MAGRAKKPPSPRRYSGTELALELGVDRRTVTNWLNSDPPCPSHGTGSARYFLMAEVDRWRRETAVRQAESNRPAIDDIEEAKLRKLAAEAKLAEMAAAREEGRLVYAEHVDEVVGEIADRVRAVLINMPSNYIVHLERLGIAPEKGQAVLEEIAEELTRALRGAVEEIDDPAD